MNDSSEIQPHVLRNRSAWDRWFTSYAGVGERQWPAEPQWGIWGIPDAELRILPDVEGKDVIELGCGTAYVSSWLARRGARVTGIDNSAEQLRIARRLQDQHQLHFTLIHGYAECVPLPDSSFDLAISEYGAGIWCDPYRWIPEASRLLRPGGTLIFLVNGTLLVLCEHDDETVPVEPNLLRPYFEMYRFDWPGDESLEFHLGYGDWIRLLRANQFDIENLVELRPGADAKTRAKFVTLDWARQWPSEEVWVTTKRG